MNRNFTGGKRQREAERERKKKDKEERLRRNRAARAQGGGDGLSELGVAEPLEAVRLEDVVISVPSQARRNTGGPTRLFVGGLSSSTTAETLRAAFGKFGTMEDATIIFDRNTGRSRGFGFVTFEKGVDAAAAVTGMNGVELDGRLVKVNNAESR